jgi:hypothetical protein
MRHEWTAGMAIRGQMPRIGDVAGVPARWIGGMGAAISFGGARSKLFGCVGAVFVRFLLLFANPLFPPSRSCTQALARTSNGAQSLLNSTRSVYESVCFQHCRKIKLFGLIVFK